MKWAIPIFILSGAGIPAALSQRSASYFRGQHPLMESRIYGSSSTARDREKEASPNNVNGVWRLLFLGDGLTHGCGSKSYPPYYSQGECTDMDAGFRGALLAHLREDTGFQIQSVGDYNHPLGSEHRHQAKPGMTVVRDLADLDWKRHSPHIILIVLGRSDILLYQNPRAMAAALEDALVTLCAALPNVRVIISSILDIGGMVNDTTEIQRASLQAFNALLPSIVERRRNGVPPPKSKMSTTTASTDGVHQSMQISFTDTAKTLPALCRHGSHEVTAGGVPLCVSNEVFPTMRGYKMIAEALRHAFDESFMLDGSCVGRLHCQEQPVLNWKNNHIGDGGLRVVSSYQ